MSVISGIMSVKAHNGFVVITLCLMPYPGFDDTDTVDVVLDIVGQMADITLVLPYVLCHILGV